MSKGKYLYTESGEKYITTTDGKLILVSGEMNPCLYKKGDFLATESGTYIATEHGQLILLSEHPCTNPNFSIKCSEYFGTNLMVIKNASYHYQLSLTDEYLLDKENHATTDFIEVDPLKNYAFTSNASFFRIAFYDASKNFISSDSTEVVFNQRWIEDLPTGTKYIRISAEYFTIQDWGLYELTSERAFAITYFDKKVEVHLPDFYGVTRALVGTPDLFSLSYISDTKDKGQTIMSTEADINMYQDDYFNIDNLATSGETDIKIQYYESDLLVWSGFVMPDFFEVDIKPNPIISMVATDRLGVLKEIDFNGKRQTPRDIVLDCLAKTGLTLDSNIIYQNSYFETTTINLERYDGMSCYDVLTSVLTAFNAKVVQYGNKWNIINKLTLETRQTSNIIQIGLVDVNGRREIKPVASEVSVKMEFGGSQHYPKNWNFKKLDYTTMQFEGWSVQPTDKVNTRQVIGYTVDGSVQYAELGANTNINSLQYRSNKIPALEGSVDVLQYPHKKSTFSEFKLLAGVNYKLDFRVNFTSASNVDISAYIMIRKGANYYVYYKNMNGDIAIFETTENSIVGLNPILIKSADREGFGVVQTMWNQELDIDKSAIGVSDKTDETVEFQIIIMAGRSYTSPITETDIFINSAELVLLDKETTGKGLVFKIKQGGGRFSKPRKEQTTHFSDRILTGVNGYFYNYRTDDTSIANLPNEFILQNTLREQAQMFSKARDFLSLSGNIKVNPLARYVCGDKQYVLVGGTSGRKNARVQLEEIVNEDITKIDYIYTYFD